MTDNAARQAAINRLAVALNIPEEIITVITPGPGATSTEALRAIEPNPHRSCNRVVNGQCMFTNDTCTPTCHLDW